MTKLHTAPAPPRGHPIEDGRSAYADLAARCEAATGPDRVLDAEIYVVVDPERENLDALAINGAVGSWVPYYTASLDAAMTLVPAGVSWVVGIDVLGEHFANVDFYHRRKGATPALALCAAALRAQGAA